MLNYSKDIILIPAKGTSLRCPNKNLMLIDWAIDYLGNNISRTVLITDSDELIEVAKKSGLKYYKSNIVDGELKAMYDFLKKNNYQREYFIHLPLTQPLREIDLIDRLDNKETDKDFIVSSNRIVNRNIFNIEDNKFIYESFERKGCLCDSVNSIDGAIYKINFIFLSLSSFNLKNKREVLQIPLFLIYNIDTILFAKSTNTFSLSSNDNSKIFSACFLGTTKVCPLVVCDISSIAIKLSSS